MKNYQIILACCGLTLLTACQSQQVANKTTTATATPIINQSVETQTPTRIQMPKNFNINGKIGLTTPKQAGSAFYVWTQQGQNFGIELSGAFNAGQTNISFNGQTARLSNEKGEMLADNPEELLQKATGWQAPISQLPYWIMGEPAPSDSEYQQDDANRLSFAKNGEWTASFAYKNAEKLPNRLTINHPDGYKVVLTINRLD
ncbi:lipoprotein insertase outer membrane protein LolB [Faucicola boevrei]|uniref:lipoprotein insertase outer membrane protein LolB n=1 Tax=Faucicola boevrei TaxID=346665 RepID=UPI00035CDA0B|nr:lipoprotein insertase outer membrane protein LolB [Moraxella boevrei]